MVSRGFPYTNPPLHSTAVPLHYLHEGRPKQRQKSTLNIELGFGSDHRMTSYNRALGITRYKSIETTLRTRRLFFVGGSAHTNERRAAAKANRVRKNLEGAERRGRGGKENGPIAYRATSGRLTYRGRLESDGVKG